jgi:hypothetical protein
VIIEISDDSGNINQINVDKDDLEKVDTDKIIDNLIMEGKLDVR